MTHNRSFDSSWVQATLQARKCNAVVRLLPESTASSAEAALALGVEVPRIAKSVLLAGIDYNVLVVLCGDSRIDLKRVGELVGRKLQLAKPEDVLRVTGFRPGAVPPVGHREFIPVVVDDALMRFETVWAAGGATNAVFEIQPAELVTVSEAAVAAVARGTLK